jgi:hypothetical protein
VKQVQKLVDGDHRLWHFAGHPLSPERDGIGPSDDEFLASSHVSWVGNRYAKIGAPAHPATIKWWARFERWMRANTTPLKVHKQTTFLAFPSALRRLRSGIAYDANSWDLRPSLESLRA